MAEKFEEMSADLIRRIKITPDIKSEDVSSCSYNARGSRTVGTTKREQSPHSKKTSSSSEFHSSCSSKAKCGPSKPLTSAHVVNLPSTNSTEAPACKSEPLIYESSKPKIKVENPERPSECEFKQRNIAQGNSVPRTANRPRGRGQRRRPSKAFRGRGRGCSAPSNSAEILTGNHLNSHESIENDSGVSPCLLPAPGLSGETSNRRGRGGAGRGNGRRARRGNRGRGRGTRGGLGAPYGYIGMYIPAILLCESDSDDSDSMYSGCCGFSADEVEELAMQGIKPWDPEAHLALAVLHGYDDMFW